MDLGVGALVGGIKWVQTSRGLDRNSPAFTYYPGQGDVLQKKPWLPEVCQSGESCTGFMERKSMENLLNFAIAHELGHALCNEKDEAKAERVARECCVKESRSICEK